MSIVQAAVDLIAYRKTRGISQIEMAQRMGITQQNVSRIERSGHVRKLPIETLERYAKALGCKVRFQWKPSDSPAKAPIKAPEPVYTVVDSEEPDGFVPPEDAIWDEIKGMWFSADAGCYYDSDGEEIPIES